MSNFAIHARDIIHETKQYEDATISVSSQKGWYQRLAPKANRIRTALNWPQHIFAEAEGQQETLGRRAIPDEDATKLSRSPTRWLPAANSIRKGESRPETDILLHLQHPEVDNFKQFLILVEQQSAKSSPETWNRTFAYTDFDSLPLYVTILTLAATIGSEDTIPARRVFLERCRKTLRSQGVSDRLLCQKTTDASHEHKRQGLLQAAHMVACLEARSAVEGYTDAAIRFEQINDLRSALACIYRNVRYRVRDGQIESLNTDICSFDIENAGVDTMLAMLTATDPLKSQLTNRKSLYRRVRTELKSRGQLERGLLDGLR